MRTTSSYLVVESVSHETTFARLFITVLSLCWASLCPNSPRLVRDYFDGHLVEKTLLQSQEVVRDKYLVIILSVFSDTEGCRRYPEVVALSL